MKKDQINRLYTDTNILEKTIDMLESQIEDLKREQTLIEGKMEQINSILSNIRYMQKYK